MGEEGSAGRACVLRSDRSPSRRCPCFVELRGAREVNPARDLKRTPPRWQGGGALGGESRDDRSRYRRAQVASRIGCDQVGHARRDFLDRLAKLLVIGGSEIGPPVGGCGGPDWGRNHREPPCALARSVNASSSVATFGDASPGLRAEARNRATACREWASARSICPRSWARLAGGSSSAA